MTYSDIDVYLAGFGIDCKGKSPSVNSKWVYTKEMLADAPSDLVVRIADELGIEHPFQGPQGIDPSEGKFWAVGHFRLFLSHVSSFKVKTALLQKSLRRYGISAFVAHEDIEPTKEWLTEIEKALFTMDALVAILTPDFKESKWTDHEVGIAIGRGLLVIPIRKGIDPYGFISKFQGVQGNGKNIGEVANILFEILSHNPKTRDRMIASLVDLLLFSGNPNEAHSKLSLLSRIESIPAKHLEKLKNNFVNSPKLVVSSELVAQLNSLLSVYGIEAIVAQQPVAADDQPELPF